MNELIEKDILKIEDMIYEIRGKQVMLDSDLAKLYECTNGTKDINKAVKRNIERFPDDFCFKLTAEESLKYLRFQIGTLNRSGNRRGQHLKYLPYAFTQEGVAMLASCLRSDIAKRVSVDIMRAFVMMRRYISNDLIEQKYINKLVLNHEERLKIVESTFTNFKENNNHLFFKGQVYDAYSLMIDIINIDIINKSNEEIIIIDNYIALSCAAGIAAFDFYKTEEFQNHLSENIKLLEKLADELKEKYPNVVAFKRNIGMSMGIGLKSVNGISAEDVTYKVLYRAYQRGLIVISLCGTILRVQPPLTIKQEELKKAFEIIGKSIEDLLAGDISDDVFKFRAGW